jgi:prolyl oligopeptidase
MTGSKRRTSKSASAAFALTLFFAASSSSSAAFDFTPPETPVDATVESLFGRMIYDPYRWLEGLDSPEVVAWFHAQNDYARGILDALPGRAALHARLVELNAADTHVRNLQLAGDALVYMKRGPDDATFKLYLRGNLNGPERLLLDPAMYNQDGQAAAIEYFSISPNARRLAVGVALGGNEDATLHVIDVASGKPIGAPIPRARGANPVWRFDSDILFYTQQRERAAGEPASEQFRRGRAWMRTFTPQGVTNDAAIFGSGLNPAVVIDADDTPTVHVSPVSPYAIGVVSHGVQDEITLYVAPLTQLRGAATPWRKLATLEQGITDFDLRGEWIYLMTHEDAPHYQIVRWSLRDPRPFALADAEVVVPASERILRAVNVAKDALYVRETEAGYDLLRRLEYNVKLKRVAAPVARSKSKSRASAPKSPAALPKTAGIARGTTVKLPFRGAVEELVTDPLRSGALVRVAGWTEAPEYLSIDGKTGAATPTTLLPRTGVDWSGISVTETMVTSHDGVAVPLTIVSPKNIAHDGGAPLLLEAYGAYGISEAPEFWPSLAAWLERGGVYAIAHVRGGGELGEEWHLGGFHATKPNSWRDAIAAAQYLIDNQWTKPAKLALLGSSAGGLTVSNAMVERPDLFAAMVSQSGFHDALRSETGAAGPANVPEFGSVATAEGLADLLAMSSYARIEDGVAYPAAMFTIGFRDARVDPWDPGKMAARLQAANAWLEGSGKPVLLRVDFAGGHGTGAAQVADETTDLFAFLLWRTGAPDFALP